MRILTSAEHGNKMFDTKKRLCEFLSILYFALFICEEKLVMCVCNYSRGTSRGCH